MKTYLMLGQVLKKKSKDTLFLKTILMGDKNILTQATAIWSKEI